MKFKKGMKVKIINDTPGYTKGWIYTLEERYEGPGRFLWTTIYCKIGIFEDDIKPVNEKVTDWRKRMQK